MRVNVVGRCQLAAPILHWNGASEKKKIYILRATLSYMHCGGRNSADAYPHSEAPRLFLCFLFFIYFLFPRLPPYISSLYVPFVNPPPDPRIAFGVCINYYYCHHQDDATSFRLHLSMDPEVQPQNKNVDEDRGKRETEGEGERERERERQ